MNKLAEPIYVRLKPLTREKVMEAAKETDHSVSKIIRDIVEKHFKRTGT